VDHRYVTPEAGQVRFRKGFFQPAWRRFVMSRSLKLPVWTKVSPCASGRCFSMLSARSITTNIAFKTTSGRLESGQQAHLRRCSEKCFADSFTESFAPLRSNGAPAKAMSFKRHTKRPQSCEGKSHESEPAYALPKPCPTPDMGAANAHKMRGFAASLEPSETHTRLQDKLRSLPLRRKASCMSIIANRTQSMNSHGTVENKSDTDAV
jgi:hypothetical protein